MALEHNLDEYLDLVDENDNVVGKKKRSEVYAENLSNFRVINAFVINLKGEIWIPRRAAKKRIYPLCLDMSMGGHVESGESYEDALRRELREELNINVDKAVIRLLGHLTPQKDGVSAYMKVYEIKMNETPDYNKNDFTELDEKTNELLKETKIPISIYDGNNNLIHEIIPRATQLSNTPTVEIPYNNDIIKLGYIETKDLSEQELEPEQKIDCDSLSKQACIDSKECVYIYYGPGYDPITGITTILDVWHCIECKPANCPSAPQKYCLTFNYKCNANCEWTGPPTLTQARGCQPK